LLDLATANLVSFCLVVLRPRIRVFSGWLLLGVSNLDLKSPHT
jgi:hypothetical protein